MTTEFKDYAGEILSKLRIEDVIGEYIQLRRSGRRYSAVCPFHADKDPSLSVNPEKGFWHCFGCGAGGNLFSFIMRIENMTFSDALHFLADKAGIEIKLSEERSAEYRMRTVLSDIIKESAKFYHELLFSSDSGKQALSYLKARGLTEAVIRRFGLGFAPSGRTNLSYYLEKKSINRELALKSGMISIFEDGSSCDYFRNRITIPILDHMGRFIAMGGRILDESGPKYINSPETPLYRKSDHLFGLNLTKQDIVKTDTAVMVEGYFDLISLWQHGITNVTASLGTSLTSSQANLLRKFCSKTILAYDADGAGRMAAGKGAELLMGAGIIPKVAEIMNEKDPDSFIQSNGKQEFQKILNNSLGVVEYHIETQKKTNDLSSPQGKSNFVKEVMAVIEKLKDQVIIAEYIKKISEDANVSESVLRHMLKGRRYDKDLSVFRSKQQSSSPEEKILTVIFQYPSLVGKVSDYLSLSDISDPVLQRIYEILFSFPPKDVLCAEDFSAYSNEEGLIKKIMELVMSENLQVTSPETANELIVELLEKIRDAKLAERLKELKKEVELALLKKEIAHDDGRFIEYQRILQHFKGRK